MPTCKSCKQSHFGMFELKGGYCKTCLSKVQEEQKDVDKRREIGLNSGQLDKILLTTEHQPSLEVSDRLGIVSAECAFGMSIFKDVFAGVRDIVGGRSKAVQDVMKDSREVVLFELRQQAFDKGADAVIAVSFNYVDLSSAGNMILMVGTGTAVRMKPNSSSI